MLPESSQSTDDNETGDGSGGGAASLDSTHKNGIIKKLFRSEDPAIRKSGVRSCKTRYMNAREVTVSAKLRAGRYAS